MRLHLDTSNTTAATESTSANPALSGTGKANAGLATSGSGGASASGSRDTVAVSGASSAWSASFSDRAARVGQLSAAVRGGTYHVSSSAISQSIVSSAAIS
jgi:anti-sigma28 factor (negative regulator of flagellin synthesis)